MTVTRTVVSTRAKKRLPVERSGRRFRFFAAGQGEFRRFLFNYKLSTSNLSASAFTPANSASTAASRWAMS